MERVQISPPTGKVSYRERGGRVYDEAEENGIQGVL